MKKITSVILAIALIFALAVTAMAAEIADCTVSADSVSATAGGTVTVPIRISGNRGFTNFGIALDYDREQLELLSILKRMVRERKLAVLMSLHELELAERVSDTVVCVAGDRIDRVGPPEEIFTREYIAKLYHMEPGQYDPCFDTREFVP